MSTVVSTVSSEDASDNIKTTKPEDQNACALLPGISPGLPPRHHLTAPNQAAFTHDLPLRPPNLTRAHGCPHPGLAGGHGGGLDPVLPINGIAARPPGFSVRVTHIHCAYIVHRSLHLVRVTCRVNNCTSPICFITTGTRTEIWCVFELAELQGWTGYGASVRSGIRLVP